jgi:hypothetical protein
MGTSRVRSLPGVEFFTLKVSRRLTILVCTYLLKQVLQTGSVRTESVCRGWLWYLWVAVVRRFGRAFCSFDFIFGFGSFSSFFCLVAYFRSSTRMIDFDVLEE